MIHSSMQWCDFHHCGQYKQSRSLATWFTPATLEQLICFGYCPKATVLGVHIPLQWYWLASAESCGHDTKLEHWSCPLGPWEAFLWSHSTGNRTSLAFPGHWLPKSKPYRFFSDIMLMLIFLVSDTCRYWDGYWLLTKGNCILFYGGPKSQSSPSLEWLESNPRLS